MNLIDFLFGIKHDFDLDNPLIDEVETTHKHSINGKTETSTHTFTGYKCKKCDKVLWLDREAMEALPGSMKYGCAKNNYNN